METASVQAGGSHWLCCQLGAREHYAVPRALSLAGALDGLVTDAWVPPGHLLGRFSAGLRERFHPALAQAGVTASNLGIAAFELRARLLRLRGWNLVMARNAWFQRMAVRRLRRLEDGGRPRNLFAYSYAARDLLKHARTRGWRTVLGQIDPGPPEERLVEKLYLDTPGQGGQWKPAPASYWRQWREECSLADGIIVNSPWSKEALESEGVPAAKLHVLPLAYEAPQEAATYRREYPTVFSMTRPLRVLFLGQINLRKGLGPLLDAWRMLEGQPVELWLAGPVQIKVPEDLRQRAGIRWLGAVPRSGTAALYREADVFLFPTLSDGFGLTQLEAQAWRLPVIASRHCGEVVVHEKNGLLLPEATAPVIADAVRRCIREPEALRRWSEASAATAALFGLERLSERLMSLQD